MEEEEEKGEVSEERTSVGGLDQTQSILSRLAFSHTQIMMPTGHAQDSLPWNQL